HYLIPIDLTDERIRSHFAVNTLLDREAHLRVGNTAALRRGRGDRKHLALLDRVWAGRGGATGDPEFHPRDPRGHAADCERRWSRRARLRPRRGRSGWDDGGAEAQSCGRVQCWNRERYD